MKPERFEVSDLLNTITGKAFNVFPVRFQNMSLKPVPQKIDDFIG